MFTGSLPPIVAQLLLIAVLLGVFVFILRTVASSLRNRRLTPTLHTLAEQEASAIAADLPRLTTPQRVTAPITAIRPAPVASAPPLIEIGFGRKRLVFTPTDFTLPGIPERYASLAATTTQEGVDLALFALCTLDAGGAEAIRSQIKDYDKIQDAQQIVRLIPAQTQPGDYVVIGRILSHRRDEVSEGVPVLVYRTEVIKSDNLHLLLELAVPDEGQSPFTDGAMVHGTARLYGYLPSSE